jgi:hypothetical protein
MVVYCARCKDTGIITRICSCKLGTAIVADNKKCGFCLGTGIRFECGQDCGCVSQRTFITDMYS